MTKKQFFLLGFFSFLFFFAEAQNLRTIKNSAQQYFSHAKYREALHYYSQYNNRQKNDLDVVLKMGYCLYETNDLTQAKRFLNYYIENEKKPNPKAYLFLGKTNHAENNFKAAAHNYKRFIALTKDTDSDRTWAKEAVRRCGVGIKALALDQRAFVENLGEKVNSQYDDFNPVLSPNYSDKIYFSSTRRESIGGPRNARGLKDEKFGQYASDMYSSQIINGEWIATNAFNSLLNTARNEVVLAFNTNGSVMFYFQGKDRNSGQILVDTFKANVEDRSLFSSPFRGPMNGELGDHSPYFFNDTTLIFSSRRADGFGGYDLYLSVKSNGQWSRPENLGAEINSPFDEINPFLAKDGRTLYFSSNNRNSIGGMDVFKTHFDDNKLSWSTPENLGIPINSSEDDLYFKLANDGLKAYFSSSRKTGFGKSDIYVAYFKSFQKEQESYSDLLCFRDAIIAKQAAKEKKTSNPTQEVIDGYPTFSEAEIVEYNFEPLYYESDDQVLTLKNIKTLERLAVLLKKFQELKIELTSNSDETGPKEFDLYFAIKRAEKAGNFLKSLGVRDRQIILKANGAQYPIAKNYLNGQASLIGQRLNRRIDIEIHHTEKFPVRIIVEKPNVSKLLFLDDWAFYNNYKKGLTYKVQIAAIKQMYHNSEVLSRFSPASIEKSQGSDYYKYTVGFYKTFASANELRKELVKNGIVDAFVVPYIDGLRASEDDTKFYAAAFPDLLNFIASKTD